MNIITLKYEITFDRMRIEKFLKQLINKTMTTKHEHDYENAIKVWRWQYICPECKKDISLAIAYIQDALNK